MVPVRLRRGVNEVEEVRGSKMGPGGGVEVGGKMGWGCRGREGYARVMRVAGCQGGGTPHMPGGT